MNRREEESIGPVHRDIISWEPVKKKKIIKPVPKPKTIKHDYD